MLFACDNAVVTSDTELKYLRTAVVVKLFKYINKNIDVNLARRLITINKYTKHIPDSSLSLEELKNKYKIDKETPR